jgi:hypothetical protein
MSAIYRANTLKKRNKKASDESWPSIFLKVSVSSLQHVNTPVKNKVGYKVSGFMQGEQINDQRWLHLEARLGVIWCQPLR